MSSDAEILWPSDSLDGPELTVHQQIQRVLVNAMKGAKLGTAAGAVLERFEGNMPNAQAARTFWQLPLARKDFVLHGTNPCCR